ncbi:conserved hypothetical protein [delta proteobacterium NaphS2]|nr:conserved hypothetical protein [delta proteobacterium NaphS2]
MQNQVVPARTKSLLKHIAGDINQFYLAGGTGLALQLGHRISEDLDFFSEKTFETEDLVSLVDPDKIISTRPGALNCIKEGVKLSFLFYEIPLCFQVHFWEGVNVAAWQDVVAEKIKTISQRGAKKDFWDVYAVIKLCASLELVSDFFLKRFENSRLNLYHVLKSLVYFEDAENEPDPILLPEMKSTNWSQVKHFFEKNVKNFEKALFR